MDTSAQDREAMHNIATYHREHERYYTMSQLELAADLAREANRLKIVADAWLRRDGSADPGSGAVDYANPRFQAAGCPDLNALGAIAVIGVLFMEGEREPAEIRTLKGKLTAIALGLQGAGRWLAEKIDAAWQRESVLFTPELIDAAWPRFQTIVTDWRGSREMELVGKLLGVAVECLEKIDFSPQTLRGHRERSAKMLRTIGWMLDLAARLLARSASSIGENDEAWTRYLTVLEEARRPA